MCRRAEARRSGECINYEQLVSRDELAFAKRSMGTLRPVLESIFPEFDGGNTATLARGQATHGMSGYFFSEYTGKKIDHAES